MLLPIGDDNSAIKIKPYVTYALIAANVLVWIICQQMSGESHFTYSFSTVPAEIITGKDIIQAGGVEIDKLTGVENYLPPLYETPIPVYFTLLTSMFMHGGWMHLLGNMLYLFIFGDNLENRLGRKRYLLFYLLTGIVAGLSHVFSTYFTHANSAIPCLGASGAISGILGGYIMLFPKLKVKTLFFYMIINIPAYIALGLWIAFQIVSGLGIFGGEGGVAYAAHVGGFLAGMMLIKLFDKREEVVS